MLTVGSVAQQQNSLEGDGYCAVTVVSGIQRLDVALPVFVPCADLLPGLVRLLSPTGEQSTGVEMALTPLGRTRLGDAETLSEAGVLAGDVLTLGLPGRPLCPAGVLTVRDRIEDAVDARGGRWRPDRSREFLLWAFMIVAAVLLVPAVELPVGMPAAGLAATVAVIIAATTVFCVAESEILCAATCGLVGCGWAAVAGTTLLRAWVPGLAVAATPLPLGFTAAAAVSAVLVATAVGARHPVALLHVTTLLTVVGGAAVAWAARSIGAPPTETAGAVAVLAVMMVGVLPRIALASAGLTDAAGTSPPAGIDRRIGRADRVLTGCIVGVSAVAVLGAVPVALSDDASCRLLAAGIGVLLLLRSRAFSRVKHVVGPLIAGLLVCCGLWLALYRMGPHLHQVLILGAVACSALLAVVSTRAGAARSAVARARIGRLLNAVEQVLVVAVIVLAIGVLGVFSWVSSVLG